MKNNKTKKTTKKDRRRLAVQIVAIVLTAIFLAGALYYTIYFTISKVKENKEKKNAATQAAYAVTEVAELPAYRY